MTRARDVASILTAASTLGTDVETATAISTHATALNGHTTRGNTASKPVSGSVGDLYSNTETGYIEVYTSSGWSQLGVIPTSATIGTATDVGTNMAYNAGSASITFTPGAGGGLVTSYTAASTSGGYSASGSSSPIVVENIPVGTSATFTVTATNGYGNALASSASNSATITTVPQAPTIGTATNPSGSAYSSTAPASLTFTAGATGGKTISNYKYSIDNSTYTALSPADTTSPVTIPGLTSGSSYTLRLKAVNENGDSIATSASNSVTISTVPQAPTIGTVTSPTGSSASVPFTAGATGSSAITSYTATSSPGNITGTGSSSPITVAGLTAGTAYTFTVTATNANGTSSSSGTSNSVTPTYTLGGVGQGNGRIFYDAGSTLSWGRYLEAAESGWTDGNYDWQAPTQNDFVSGTSSAIGTGKANTDLMVAAKPTGGYAGTAARSYSSGGVTWSLPSPDEMVQLVTNRSYLSNSLSSGYSYWTSHNLGSGGYSVGPVPSTTVSLNGKGGGLFVRPVRAF